MFVMNINLFATFGLIWCTGKETTALASYLGKFQRNNALIVENRDEILSVTESLVSQIQDAPEFIFLINENSKGIDNLLREIWEKKAASAQTILYNDQSIYDTWMNTLRRSLKPNEVRIVFLILDIKQTLDVLSKVGNSNQESEYVNWIIVSKEKASDYITPILREGSQIIIAEKTDTENEVKYELKKSFVDEDNSIRLFLIGEGKCSPKCELYIRTPTLAEPISKSYRDFGGRRLTVMAIDNWPFVTLAKENNTIRMEKIGIDDNILDLIASKLNFSYEIKEPFDCQWGHVLKNGSVTGMVGMVSRREAHLAIDEFTITDSRETVVDFTSPYYIESTTILTRAPQRATQTWQAFSPFRTEIWLFLAIATLVVGPILQLVDGDHLGSNTGSKTFTRRANNYSFEIFRIMARQDLYLKLNSWPSRLVLISWAYFCLIISLMYSTTLVAFLTIPSMERPIDSLSELLRSCTKDGTSIILNYGSSNDGLFKEATSGIYQNIYSCFEPQTGYVIDRNEGVNKVLNENAAFINARLHSEAKVVQYGRDKLRLARQMFYPQAYGIVVPNGAPYKITFDEMLIESGLIGKWSQEAISPENSKKSLGDENRDAVSEKSQKSSDRPESISVDNLHGAFVILGIGYILSLICYLIEFVISKLFQKQ